MQLTCTFRILDEVSTLMLGVQKHHLDQLVAEFAEFVPGYRYMPTFKMGAWDGKTKFVTPAGKTYQVFIPNIVRKLAKHGYKFKTQDNRVQVNIDVQRVTDQLFAEYNWILRQHQVDAINAVIENGHRGLILAATSAGKTSIVAGLSVVYGSIGFRSIIIVPSRDLIKQTLDQYLALGIDTGQYSGTEKDLEHQHVISTWQALQNNPQILLKFHVFICDEVQLAKSAVVAALLIRHSSHMPVRIGCTGTVPKDPADYKTIYAAIGEREVYTITAKQLQDLKLVSTLGIKQLVLQDALNPLEDNFPEYVQEKKALAAIPERQQWIANFIQETATQYGNTLVLVSSVPQGKKLQKLIGDSSVFLYGADEDIVRQEVYRSFDVKDGLMVIANVQIAAVGLSINRIFNLILVDIGKAFTRVIQSIGRGLRMASDKSHVNVIDVCSNYSFSTTHSRKRLEYYREAEYPYEIIRIPYRNNIIEC